MKNEDNKMKIEKTEDGKYILTGVFTEFSRKTRGRIYKEEDYLPHIEELKKKKAQEVVDHEETKQTTYIKYP